MVTIYNKLVRDRIPEIIKNAGKIAEYEVLSQADYAKMLEKKLDEETAEFHSSKDVEELADILEVLYAIGKAEGISPEQLDKIRAEKAEKRGKFDKRFFLLFNRRRRVRLNLRFLAHSSTLSTKPYLKQSFKTDRAIITSKRNPLSGGSFSSNLIRNASTRAKSKYFCLIFDIFVPIFSSVFLATEEILARIQKSPEYHFGAFWSLLCKKNQIE